MKITQQIIIQAAFWNKKRKGWKDGANATVTVQDATTILITALDGTEVRFFIDELEAVCNFALEEIARQEDQGNGYE